MAEQYNILQQPVAFQPKEPLRIEISALVPCPDCQHKCSTKAETCPACGRYFRSYNRTMEVTPGSGWSIVVGWGVILGWIFAGLIVAALLVVLVVLGALGAASLMEPRAPSDTTRPSRP